MCNICQQQQIFFTRLSLSPHSYGRIQNTIHETGSQPNQLAFGTRQWQTFLYCRFLVSWVGEKVNANRTLSKRSIPTDSTGNVLKSNDANDRKQEYMDLYRNMAFSQDGSLLASAGEDKKINVYDANDWSLKYSR